MLVSVFQLLAVKREEIEAEAGLVAAFREYQIASHDLQQLIIGSGHSSTTVQGEQK